MHIHYSTSFLNFLKSSQNKISKVLISIHNKSMYRKDYNSILIHDKSVNYLTLRSNGELSYLPYGKEHRVNDSGEWMRDGRQSGKPAKVIRKIFTDSGLKLFKESDFETFANEYKSTVGAGQYTIDILSASYIKDVYDSNIREGNGTLNSSCMNGDSQYLDIYENCKSLQIVTLRETTGDNALCGRALLWTINDNITLMDRIYTTDDFMYQFFLDLCEECIKEYMYSW